MKKCYQCKKQLSKNQFYKNKSQSSGLSTRCKECEKKRNSYRLKYYYQHRDKILNQMKSNNNKPSNKYNSYKNNAKKRQIDFDLTFKQFKQFWQKSCNYCGKNIDTIGLDRIDNNKGYNVKNVKSCCKVCNRMKSNLSEKDFLEHCNAIVHNV